MINDGSNAAGIAIGVDATVFTSTVGVAFADAIAAVNAAAVLLDVMLCML